MINIDSDMLSPGPEIVGGRVEIGTKGISGPRTARTIAKCSVADRDTKRLAINIDSVD